MNKKTFSAVCNLFEWHLKDLLYNNYKDIQGLYMSLCYFLLRECEWRKCTNAPWTYWAFRCQQKQRLQEQPTWKLSCFTVCLLTIVPLEELHHLITRVLWNTEKRISHWERTRQLSVLNHLNQRLKRIIWAQSFLFPETIFALCVFYAPVKQLNTAECDYKNIKRPATSWAKTAEGRFCGLCKKTTAAVNQTTALKGTSNRVRTCPLTF